MSESIGQLIAGLHPLERKVLAVFKEEASVWDHQLSGRTGLDESRLAMALGWLLSKEILRVREEETTTFVSLTDLGRTYANTLYPERRILDELSAGKTLLIQDIKTRFGLEQLEVSTAIGNLKQHGIVRVGQGGTLELLQGDYPYEGIYRDLLNRLQDGKAVKVRELSVEEQLFLEQRLEKDWKTRGIMKWSEKTSKCFNLTMPLGEQLVQRLPDEAVGAELTQLTPEMLKDGSWQDKSFRKYHIALKPPRITAGRAHPYRQFLHGVQTKLVSMGFQEMRGPLVESEFWNMDALYMPQFHPARDIHDVYFVKELAPADDIDPALLERVAVTHERGGPSPPAGRRAGAGRAGKIGSSGSTGWRYRFDRARARQPILRSQGTSVSARTLADRPRVPGKYFSIARCFRYDQVDATHAPDFFQIEGIVLDASITFRTLLGLLKLFAVELARAEAVKFLPAYFPFTEPSVELHVRHPRLGWIELGGAGLFRPEVTTPMGVTVPVIAWGLGLDRMAMVAMGLHDIRDLFAVDLEFLRALRPPPPLADPSA